MQGSGPKTTGWIRTEARGAPRPRSDPPAARARRAARRRSGRSATSNARGCGRSGAGQEGRTGWGASRRLARRPATVRDAPPHQSRAIKASALASAVGENPCLVVLPCCHPRLFIGILYAKPVSVKGLNYAGLELSRNMRGTGGTNLEKNTFFKFRNENEFKTAHSQQSFH
jgi:hypothetical protein